MTNVDDIPQPIFLSSPKVATLCGVTRNTVCCWIRDGKLPSYRTAGGKNLIRPGDLLNFMQSHHMFVPDALRELAAEDRQEGKADAQVPAVSAEPAVLVVDDDHEARKLSVRCLRPLDLPILEAETGYEALHILLQNPHVALVVLDMVMPGQHGSDTFTEIRRTYPGMPVIVCSGLQVEEIDERMGDQRPDLIVTKPYNLSHLLEAARAFLADVGF